MLHFADEGESLDRCRFFDSGHHFAAEQDSKIIGLGFMFFVGSEVVTDNTKGFLVRTREWV